MTESASVRDRRRAAIEAACVPWVARASALAAAKLADARAHAALAITRGLVSAPDGRATLARSARNRSLAAARTRLAELLDALAGPTARSLEGLVSDAWEESYRDSRSYWSEVIGPEFTRGTGPSKAELATARGLVLSGYDARTRLNAVLAPASSRLRAVVVAAASPRTSLRDRSASLRAWEVATTKAVALACQGAIVTGAFRCDVLAGRAVIRPELLHPDPTLAGA